MGKATTDNDTAGARRDFFPGFNTQMIQNSGAIWTCNSSFGILWDIIRTTHSLMWSTGFPGGDCPPVQRVYWSAALPVCRRGQGEKSEGTSDDRQVHHQRSCIPCRFRRSEPSYTSFQKNFRLTS